MKSKPTQNLADQIAGLMAVDGEDAFSGFAKATVSTFMSDVSERPELFPKTIALMRASKELTPGIEEKLAGIYAQERTAAT